MMSNYSVEVLERKYFSLQNDLRFYQLMNKDSLKHQLADEVTAYQRKIDDIQLSMIELRHGIACIRDNSFE